VSSIGVIPNTTDQDSISLVTTDTQTSPSMSSTNSLSVGSIVGITIGCVIVVILLGLGVLFINHFYWKERNESSQQYHEWN